MWTTLIRGALTQLFALCDPETIRNFVDAGLDAIEDKHIEGEVDTGKEYAIRKSIDLIRAIARIEDEKYGSDKK